ncbi:MAG TPA: lipid-A-disaccharide synthase [candidate division Zixibacteria bacterium]|nr:lipid-A-disaccharide synthase [candidate division Zixibacteria bacterium]
MAEKSIFISAGDPSGDNAGSLLLSALKKRTGAAEFFGLGGKRMLAEGQEQLVDGSKLAVMGFWEVVKHYGFFRKLFFECLDEIKSRRPSCVILIDYPGFNLRLAKEVKKLGIPVIYYISPQVWAWGKKRVADIKENVDKMIVILPFEKEFYNNNGVECEFVGHYLLEDIPANYIRSAIPPDGHIAILPGSRPQEIKRLLPPMLEAVQRFNKEYGTRGVIAGVRGVFDYDSELKKFESGRIEIEYDNPRKVIFESSIVLTKSGTATLETAIIDRPMVVAYKTSFLTYLIAKNLIKLDTIALVNLVLGKKVVPELIQNEANSNNMYVELKKLRDNKDMIVEIKRELDRVPEILGGAGASERAAEIILKFVN